MSVSLWTKHIKPSDYLFHYLHEHYHDLFDEENRIKHFDMRPASASMLGHYETIQELYGNDIHNAIVPWIHNEYLSGRLMNKDNWKPFHDPDCYSAIYNGYRILFSFNNYLFQLAMDNDGDCINNEFTYWTSFQVALYGWKQEDVDEIVRPSIGVVDVSDDMTIPQHDWVPPKYSYIE
jgi:hypothetical protein